MRTNIADVTNIVLGEKYQSKLGMLRSLSALLSPEEIRNRLPESMIAEASKVSLGELDGKVKNRKDLSFIEALGGMLYVVYATNNLVRNTLAPSLGYDEAIAKGSYFLTLMAAKESFVGLTDHEVAGLVAASQLDIVYFPKLESVFETAGMGADRGWGSKDIKTINISTLSAFVIASLDLYSMKHGSYGNTTKVGSTDVPEKFGANIVLADPDQIQELLDETKFWFSDAHSVKTLHYLSHLLMVETINHVIGPMTAPVSKETKLYKVLGVNQNVHPKVIAKAYAFLHRLGLVNLGGVVALGGVDVKPNATKSNSPSWFKEHSYLDELSPTATVVSMAAGQQFLGTEVVDAGTFGLTIDEETLKVRNELAVLLKADEEALRGGPLAEYLACNVALVLSATDLERGLDYKAGLRANFQRALASIENGDALATLDNYVQKTGGKRVSWL